MTPPLRQEIYILFGANVGSWVRNGANETMADELLALIEAEKRKAVKDWATNKAYFNEFGVPACPVCDMAVPCFASQNGPVRDPFFICCPTPNDSL